MTETPKPWTADQPLRVDATNEQIIDRAMQRGRELGVVGNKEGITACLASVAREFAAACLAAHPDSKRLDWLADDTGNRWSEAWRKWNGEGPFRDTLREAIDAAMSQPDAAQEGQP